MDSCLFIAKINVLTCHRTDYVWLFHTSAMTSGLLTEIRVTLQINVMLYFINAFALSSYFHDNYITITTII